MDRRYLIGSMDSKTACETLSSNPEAMASLLLFVAIREARRYKWERSSKAGKDLGQQEVINWFSQNWAHWYRDHWIAHLNGKECWVDFDQQEFGLAKSRPDNNLFNQIIKSVADYGENLGIIMWATKTDQDMQQVLSVLKVINMNAKRISIDEKSIIALAKALDEADKYKWIQSEKAGHDLGDNAIKEWFQKNWDTFYKEFVQIPS